jgi:hypothetical protein
MASIAAFYPYVLPYVTGCSVPLAEQHILGICRDFCGHAPIVQERLDAMDAIQGQAEYELDLPNGTDLTLVLEATYQGRELPCVKTGDYSGASMTAHPGTPTSYRQSADNLITFDFAPISTESKAINLLVATKPMLNAKIIADILLNDYGYQIGLGVVGRLMLIPGQPFSNPRDAAVYTAQYNATRSEARIRADMSFGSGESRVRPRRFA